MLSSAPEVSRLINKWVQEHSHLFLRMAIDPPFVTVSASGEAVSASVKGEAFVFKVGDAEFNFIASDAEFEYLEPREAGLQPFGISEEDCICCLNIKVRDLVMLGKVSPTVVFLVCELRAS